MKLISKALRMARVKGSHSVTCHPHIFFTNGMSRPVYTPNRTASPHFGRYSFPVPQRVGGWVGLTWSLPTLSGSAGIWFCRRGESQDVFTVLTGDGFKFQSIDSPSGGSQPATRHLLQKVYEPTTACVAVMVSDLQKPAPISPRFLS